MDPSESFYQELDSEQLLKKHGQELVVDAREALGEDPDARVAGLITTPDSGDARQVREMLSKLTGQAVGTGLMVGLVPRQIVEALLSARVGREPWSEEPWQRQSVLPVVVSTRDGHRFGFFGLGREAAE